MTDSFLTLLQLFAATDGITSRKKCQKLVHIFQECGIDFGLDFELALYGAYSPELQSLIDNLVKEKYLNEEPVTSGRFPTTHYIPRKRVNAILEELGETTSPEWQELARTLNAKSPRELETVSTILFLQSAGIPETVLKDQFGRLKQHLTDEFDAGLKLAKELRPNNEASSPT
ncbi:MAG TPA: hypothetical protein VK041_09045 [Opitutales bacterium]|nr:hypothetical protein [Opitutales bacterium]